MLHFYFWTVKRGSDTFTDSPRLAEPLPFKALVTVVTVGDVMNTEVAHMPLTKVIYTYLATVGQKKTDILSARKEESKKYL